MGGGAALGREASMSLHWGREASISLHWGMDNCRLFSFLSDFAERCLHVSE